MSDEIHIIAPFAYANNVDWHAIDLYLEYNKTRPTKLWSTTLPNTELALKYPIQKIRPFAGLSPNNGTLVIMGCETEVKSWYENANFDKVVLYHNKIAPSLLYSALNRLNISGEKKAVEVAYTSKYAKQLAGLPGKVLYHIPNAERFQPLINNHSSDRFVVGRISIDHISKYHHSDIDLYKLLADQNISVELYGGNCLAPWLGNYPNIKLLPTPTETDLNKIYATLDCFIYRVPTLVKEALGLMVIEAMLSRVPIVCHREIGAAELIEHGVNGFVYDTNLEAIEIIKTLKNNANLRKNISINAQKYISQLRNSYTDQLNI